MLGSRWPGVDFLAREDEEVRGVRGSVRDWLARRSAGCLLLDAAAVGAGICTLYWCGRLIAFGMGWGDL